MKKTLLMLAAVFAAALAPVFAIEATVAPTLLVNLPDQWGGLPPGRPPYVTTAAKVVRHQPFRIEIIYGRMALKDGGAAVRPHLEMRYLADGRSPWDGALEMAEERFSCENTGTAFLITGRSIATFEDGDRPGVYEITATVKDLNDGTEARATARIELLAEPPAPEPIADINAFLSTYYRAPQPERLLPAFRTVLAEILPKMRERQKQNFNPMPVAAFFIEALRLNPQLHEEFIRLRSEYEDPFDGGFLDLVLLNLGGKSAEAVPPAERERLGRLSFTVTEVTQPYHLDILWSQFFATGRQAPVRLIAGAIGSLQSPMTVEKYRELAAPAQADREALLRHLIGRAALWSLNSNAANHPLVRFYLEGMLLRRKLEEPFTVNTVAAMLRRLNQAPEEKKTSESPAEKPPKQE